MPRFDIAIVGAGPAGSWAAHRLARSGARVAIFDPSHPREKPCGGGVTGRALAMVHPALSAATDSVRIAGARFTHNQRTAAVALGEDEAGFPPLVVTGREEFDRALLDAAVSAGATWLPFRVTGIHRESSEWIISGREGTYRAEWLVGADGANSLVRRQVFRPFPRASLSIATGFFVRDRSSDEIVVDFVDDPPGYLWSFPRPDHLAVGICAQADAGTSASLLAYVSRWIEGHVGPGARVDRYSWPIPSLDAKALADERPAGENWLLIGDAAGLVDPITREGIFFALRSADFAADALTSRQQPAVSYAKAVREQLHAELIRAARLKARFFQPRFIDLLISALSRSARIRAIMADLVAGRQTYDGLRRRLLQTLELKLMWELFGQ